MFYTPILLATMLFIAAALVNTRNFAIARRSATVLQRKGSSSD